MKIITIQANRGGADAAAQAIVYILGLIGCAMEDMRKDMVITYDELAKQATLEVRENTLLAFFKVHGQQRMRTHVGRLDKMREINGYLMHPMIKENIPMYQEYVNVCRTGGQSHV